MPAQRKIRIRYHQGAQFWPLFSDIYIFCGGVLLVVFLFQIKLGLEVSLQSSITPQSAKRNVRGATLFHLRRVIDASQSGEWRAHVTGDISRARWAETCPLRAHLCFFFFFPKFFRITDFSERKCGTLSPVPADPALGSSSKRWRDDAAVADAMTSFQARSIDERVVRQKLNLFPSHLLAP